MNGSDVVFSNGDDCPPDSPVLVPRRVELRISPSPPPPVTEVRQRPPHPALPPSASARASNRPKIKNSLGDAVLIRHMDNGRDPDIAHYEAERDYSDSSHLDEGDAGEGDPLPEPERAGDGDSDTSIDDMPDMPDLRPHATASPRRESIPQWHFGAVAAPEHTLSPAPAPQEYYTSMGIMDSDGDTPNTPPEDERRRNEGRDETSPRFAATSNRSPERATGQDAGGMPSSPRHTHQGPPPLADDMADLATRAVAQSEMLRRHSTSQTSPTAGLERTPLPGARTDRSAPRLELMRKSQPSPQLSPRHIQPLQQPRRIEPAPTLGEPTIHSPLFNGDQPSSSSGAYLPSTTYDNKSALVSVSSELAPSYTRLPPPTAILLPVPKRQTSNYSSSAPPSGFHVKLSPITSDHSGGRGSAQGSHDHAHGSGTSPSTGTSLPSIHSVFNDMIHVEERPPPFAHPPASHPFSRMASHASPPGPTSPHSSTSHYITSPSSSSYTGSRRSTLDLGTEATSAGVAGQPPTLPSIHPQLRRPLPDATSTRMPSGSMAPALAPARPAADSSNVMYRRHLQDIALAAKPSLAPHRPMQQPNLAPNTNNAQGPPKQRPLQQNQNHQNQNQNQNQGQNGGASSSQGTYRCLVPGCKAQPFVTQYLLNSHANVHSDDRPHYCPEKDCPRSQPGNGFKRKNEMIRHGLVHKSPGYVCPFCPDREHKYPRPDNLLRHVRVHHKDKNKDDPELRDVLALRPDGLIRGRRRRN